MGSIRRLRGLGVAVAAACLLALVVAGSALAAGRPPHRTAKPSLSFKVVVVSNRQILATGKVRPVPARGRVVLQIRRDGAWHQLGQSPLVGHGAYSVRAVVPAGIDDARLRAALYEAQHQRGVSPLRSLRLDKPTSPSTPTGPGVTAPTSSSSPTGPGETTPGSPSSPVGPSEPEGPSEPPVGPAEPPCTPAATSAGSPPATSAGPLSAGSLMATIDRYASRPNHLSGTAESAAAESEFTGALAAAGLKVCEQAFTFPRFTPTAVGLSVEGTDVERAAIAPLLYSGATGPAGTTASLVYIGETENENPLSFTPSKVVGKIVVAKIKYQTNSKALGLAPTIEAAIEDGAAGFVAVTQAVGNYPKWEDTNARTGTGPLPVLSVGKTSGAAVVTAAEAGKTATLTLAAEHIGLSCDRDVWGELEGADPTRRVYVGVPVSSYTPSASEHGTGYAIVVGLARLYASLPKSQRPETLVFIGLGGHEIGWLGLQALLASPEGSYLKEADAYIHLGSALGAPEAEEQPPGSGTIVTLTKADKTGRLHDSENPLLVPGVIEDFEAAGAKAPETPPFTASGGEQTNAFAAGIPTASFSGASLFFHTAGDTPSTIDQSILTRQADAFRRVVDRITAIPAGKLKAENMVAAQHGAEIAANGAAAKRTPANPTLGAVRETANALAEGGVGGPAATPVAACG
jgi:hypothetical protein